MEQQIIGSLLIDEDAISKVADLLEPNMFKNPVCGLIYSEFLRGYRTGESVNYYTITERYKERPEVAMEIKYCVDATITSVGIRESAELLKSDYRARKLSDTLSRIKPNATNIEEELGKLQLEIDELRSGKSINGPKLSEMVEKHKDNYFKEHENICFGMERIDSYLTKLDRGDITTIGARPSVGKSALSAQLAMKLSEQGYKVGFFVLEMGEEQMYERFLAMKSGIPMTRIRQATAFLGDEKERFDRGNEELMKYDLRILPNCQTTDEIKAVSKACEFDLIIVDYLQLVKAKTTYKGNRVQEIAEISSEFKRMAKELKMHVILLSQLNRKTEEKRRPTMADLRESGAIEQDASNIMLMWNLKTEGEKGLSVEKNRQGKLGGVVLKFNGDLMTFEETDKDLRKEEQWETTKTNPFAKIKSSSETSG